MMTTTRSQAELLARSEEPPDDALVGRVLERRYEVVELIARGGMGKVYRGTQLDLKRECAIKVLDIASAAGGAQDEFRARFFQEAKIASKINHPNTVTIFDFGKTDDDVYFIAMEHLRGETLDAVLKRETRLPVARAVDIATQVCRGLRAAHALGAVHRDLKPGNIFIVRQDAEHEIAKILDFGLVKSMDLGSAQSHDTATGAFLGSSRYAAPEQILGAEVDGRTDLYALGVVLYQLLTGVLPFQRAHTTATLVAHVHDPVPPFDVVAPGLGIPAWLERVVATCLAKAPHDRFASAGAMLSALKAGGDGMDGSSTDEFAAKVSGGAVALDQSSSGVPSFASTASGSIVKSRSTSGVKIALAPDAARSAKAKGSPGLRRAVAPIAIGVLLATALVAGALLRRGAKPEVSPSAAAPPEPTQAVVAPSPPGTTAPLAAPGASADRAKETPAVAEDRVDRGKRAARAASPASAPPAAAVATTTTGSLFVWSRVGPCKVTVDGADHGTAPTGKIEVGAGRHTVVCVFADGRERTETVSVEAGGRASATFRVE